MKPTTICLVGNPNCGKTTVFNALTGSKQRVGNWPGVTVERKTGAFTYQDVKVSVVDLPGVYSLTMVSETMSLDEQIACRYIFSAEADVVVNIVNASNLERHLYLTSQLLEMGVPLILAVNMLDLAQQQGIKLDLPTLSKQLGCPVVALNWQKNPTLDELKAQIIKAKITPGVRSPQYPSDLQKAIAVLAQQIAQSDPPFASRAEGFAVRLLEGDLYVQQLIALPSSLAEEQTRLGEEADILIADARYGFVNTVAKAVVKKRVAAVPNMTTWIDKIVLNRVLGIPIFLAVIYLMFLFAINLGGVFQDFFDISSDTVFVQGFAQLLASLHAPAWVIALFASGVGKGINTTVTFIPVIGGMFLFLSLLENSGYMARAGFVMDRLMRALGLPGKAFVPLIIGFGCNVPAIMSARTLENPRDRILTVMMAPFMSCSARLAIFAVFAAAFFPKGSQNIVFGLYFIGIMGAIMTGWLLRKTLLQGEPSPLVTELPPYHIPKLKGILILTGNRLKNFLWRAGRYIVPICILLSILNTVTSNGAMTQANPNSESLLAVLGHLLTPLFSPMGISQDNWPATVGLITGILAKEVVIGTLNTLYTQVGHLTMMSTSGFDFWGNMTAAVASIPHNLAALPDALSNPILASAPDSTVNNGVFGQMYQRFDGGVGAFSYLLFVLLYIPCVSTMATIARELGRGWAWFSVLWNTGLAYGMAVIFYQAATFGRHPGSSLGWIVAIIACYSIFILVLQGYVQLTKRPRYGFNAT